MRIVRVFDADGPVLLSAYSICAVICASVRSGRNENCPCVIRLPVLVIMCDLLNRRHALAVAVGMKSAVSVDS